MCWRVSGGGVVSGDTLAAALIERASGPSGGRVAVFQRRLGVWEPMSWAALCEMAERIGNGLLAKGVRTGDVVAIIAKNSVEFVAAEYAVVGIGATALLISPDYSPATTAALLKANNASLAITGDEEQYDKCVDAPESPATVVVVETRGLRDLEVAGRPDRSTRSTLAQLIDDAGATSSWRSSVASVSATSLALLVTSIDGTDVAVSSLTHADLLAAGQSALDTMAIGATSRLLAQRSLAELEEQVLSVGASLLCGSSVAIGEGGPLAGSELVQVAPTHLHIASESLAGIHADASRRVRETKGIKRLALGGRLPVGAPTSAGRAPLPVSPSRLIGLATSAAVFIYLLVSPSMNDWIRIIVSLAIAAVGGLLFLRTPAAVHAAIKRRYGLDTCRAVIGDAGSVAPGSAEFLAGLGLPLVAPVRATLNSVGAVPSSLLAERLGAAQ